MMKLFYPLMKGCIALCVAAAAVFSPVDAGAQNPCSLTAVCGLAEPPTRPAGRCEVFVGRPGDKGGIFHTWQNIGGSTWPWQNPWIQYSPAPDNNEHGLASGRDAAGRIMVAWISKGNIYVAASRAKDVSLTTSPSPTFTPQPEANGSTAKFNFLTAATNAKGLVELFALDEKGHAWCFEELQQADPDALFWKWNTESLGGGSLKNISAATFNTDERMGVVATGGNGEVYMNVQINPGTPWDAWSNLGGNKIKEVHAAESSAHQFEIIALGSDAALYLQYQNVGNQTWSGWQLLVRKQFPAGTPDNPGFGPNLVFQRSLRTGDLFLIAHNNLSSSSQYAGIFGKLVQSPNNGAWPGTYRFYSAPTLPGDALESVDRNLFAAVSDASGAVHIFGYIIDSGGQVEQYIDSGVVDSNGNPILAFEVAPFIIPPIGWQ